jgi:hypothetical protein
MKIGILTQPLECNYGGILQNFALQTVLRGLGYDPLTIDWHFRKDANISYRAIKWYIKRLFKHYILKENVSEFFNTSMPDEDYAIISKNVSGFVKRHIAMTNKVFPDELEQIDKNYLFDVYVVGSDQVWNANCCPNSFLSFVHREGVKKVTYSASCCSDVFANHKDLADICRSLAADFSGISVREKSLLSVCRDSLGIEAEFALDPTLLLKPSDYLEISDRKERGPHVFSYILDRSPEKIEIASKVSARLQVPIIEGNPAEQYVRTRNLDINKCVYQPVESWLGEIATADFVVTDSFHGTCFSIIFNKPFITIGNRKRGIERFNNILSLLGLDSRMIGDVSELESVINDNIDFEAVENIINKNRRASLEFLKRCLD